jgi:hypothetical protein
MDGTCATISLIWRFGQREYILGNTEDHYDEHTSWILAIVGERSTSTSGGLSI